MRHRIVHHLHLACVAVLLLSAGCATYKPKSIDDVPFRERAEAKTEGKVTVSVAALNAAEAERLFQLPLGKQRVQPVWIQIDNRDDVAYFTMPLAVDPDYFSSDEVAYRNRAGRNKKGRAELASHLRTQHIPFYIPANSVRSGFVYTNQDEGGKVVDVILVSREEDRRVKSFTFLSRSPGSR